MPATKILVLTAMSSSTLGLIEVYDNHGRAYPCKGNEHEKILIL